MECLKKAFNYVKKYYLAIFSVLILHILLYSIFNPSRRINENLSDQGLKNLTVFFIVFLCILCLILISIILYFSYLNRKLIKEEESLKNAIKAANIVVVSFLEDGFIMSFNNNAEKKFGYDAENVIKTLRIYDFLSTKDQLKLGKIIDDSKNGIIRNNFELCIRTQKGEFRHVVFNLNVVGQNDLSKVYELMGLDITDRVNSEIELFEKHEELSAVYEELAASEEELKDQLDELINQKMMLQEKDERHNLVVEASNIGIWEWDRLTGVSFYSDKWYEIFDLNKTSVAGEEKEAQNRIILPEDMKHLKEAFNEHINKKTPYYECEYRINTGNGQIKWINSVGKALWDNEGNIIKLAGANTDITSKKEIEERVNKLAYFDTLTGLPNNTQLSERFDEIKCMIANNIALIYIDLDNFKLINDSYGHLIGDMVMIEVSNRLKSHSSDKMHISRLGGDEFAILVPDTNKEELTAFAENIINQLEAFIKVDEYSLVLSANVGIALYPQDGENVDDLLRNADTAMYRATEKKCKYLFFQAGMNDAVAERLNLRNHMKMALTKNEFMLYYQPQYRSADKKIMGFEALCRWKSEQLGMIPPSKFIPIAEESKLILPLGDWILEEAIKFLKHLHNKGYEDLIMSVNISVVQLMQKNFSYKVLGLVSAYDIPPSCLELEITESGMMESVESVLENITVLKNRDIRIALDDFGTGYSSLNYLTKLPLDTLKIDKSFVDNIGQEKEKSLLTGSIVEIGRKLGLSIVAEGVETEDQFKYLVRKRCERIQGYFFSRPLPENEVIGIMD